MAHNRDYILEALKTLIDADLIERGTQVDTQKPALDSSPISKIPVGLTRSWLLREHPLERVSKDMRD